MVPPSRRHAERRRHRGIGQTVEGAGQQRRPAGVGACAEKLYEPPLVESTTIERFEGVAGKVLAMLSVPIFTLIADPARIKVPALAKPAPVIVPARLKEEAVDVEFTVNVCVELPRLRTPLKVAPKGAPLKVVFGPAVARVSPPTKLDTAAS